MTRCDASCAASLCCNEICLPLMPPSYQCLEGHCHPSKLCSADCESTFCLHSGLRSTEGPARSAIDASSRMQACVRGGGDPQLQRTCLILCLSSASCASALCSSSGVQGAARAAGSAEGCRRPGGTLRLSLSAACSNLCMCCVKSAWRVLKRCAEPCTAALTWHDGQGHGCVSCKLVQGHTEGKQLGPGSAGT